MIDLLQALSDADLAALAAALRGGRLTPPYTALALARYCARGAALAAPFQQRANEGMQPAHLALLLDAVAQTRAARPVATDVVALVCTGPDIAGASHRHTGVVVRELFASAREHVLVVGYAVHQGREVFEVLARRMDERPSLAVRMCLDISRPQGDTSPEAELLARFLQRFQSSQWPGDRLPELFYDPRSLSTDQSRRASLHAKCVVVDRRLAFVSSANFTEAAQERNIEVGMLARADDVAARLALHFESLIEAGHLRLLR
jgi:hypothetical protein